ncbi:FAD-dependent monooxygenase [Planctomicrobium sp.]|nr:FAD-dependent monooxygenase [Planctomicrobium sp.]
MLPVGENRCSFFWGLKKTEEANVRSAGVDQWKRQVADFYPPAAEAVEHVESMDELIFASYRSVKMKRVTQGRVAFIGDAAHATSPHLGQGLNLALEDALCLSQQIAKTEDYRVALKNFESKRSPTTSYYSTLTATLTPFFQTPNRILQLGRDASLPIMPHLPYIGKQMVLTMAGLKTGWFGDKS